MINVPFCNIQENKKLIISKRLKKIKFDKEVDDNFLMSICEKMDGYIIQDLIDYCDKVMFEIFKGEDNKSMLVVFVIKKFTLVSIGGCDKILKKNVLTHVLENTVPLSMTNLKLVKEKQFNFSLVGGLKEAKQIITETIIWPSLVSLLCVMLI